MHLTSHFFIALCLASLSFFAACEKNTHDAQAEKQTTAPKPQSFKGVERQHGLPWTINGTPINFPDSEKLDWTIVKDNSAVPKVWLEIGHANARADIRAKHGLSVSRYTILGDYVLLCGMFDPPFPGADYTWIIEKNTLQYVGHFLDKDSR